MKNNLAISTRWNWMMLVVFSVLGQSLLIQRTLPWTLPAGALAYALAFWALWNQLRRDNPIPNSPIPAFWEYAGLFGILLLALALRVYRLDQFPAGLYSDGASLAYGAQRIALENWRPFSEFFSFTTINIPSIYYSLALWFRLFTPSLEAYYLYSVFLSLVTLVLLYYLYRSLTNPLTALIATFFVGVSRWFLTYSRETHPAVETPFYFAVTLVSWLYAVKSGKTWAFLFFGAAMGVSLYSYPDDKFLPILMFFYALYEWRQAQDRPAFLKKCALACLVFLVVAAPVIGALLRENGLSYRERDVLAYPTLYEQQGFFKGVLGHALFTGVTFNRQGDAWPYQNIPDYPMLDNVTGALWLLGLGLALWRVKERENFYPLLGLLVFFFPAFLSFQSQHGSRLIGDMPFLYLLAAQALTLMSRIWKTRPWLLGALLLGCLGQNAWEYFGIQVNNVDCWWLAGSTQATWFAQEIRKYSSDYTCLVDPKYEKSYQILFLDKDLAPQVRVWRLPGSLDLAEVPNGKGACVFFEFGQWGDLELFQTRYPGGVCELLRDPLGNPTSACYRIPATLLPPLSRRGLKGRRPQGLRGRYYRAFDKKGGADFTQIDPLLNFTNRQDFPVQYPMPFAIDWSGFLIAPQKGTYRLSALTQESFRVLLDGKNLLNTARTEGTVFLDKGRHSIMIDLVKTSKIDLNFTLLWQEPNSDHTLVIPATAYSPE